jgi:hypothetical protein
VNHLARPLNYLKDYWLGATGTFVSVLTVIIHVALADLYTLWMKAASTVDSRTGHVVPHTLGRPLV